MEPTDLQMTGHVKSVLQDIMDYFVQKGATYVFTIRRG